MKRFEKRVWLASPTMHGEELRYMQEAYETNWMSTVGKNIDEVERLVAEKVGVKYAVALSAGTAALHLGTRLAGVRLFGVPRAGEGALRGQKVFCSDMTFAATLNPVAYENGEAVFIDSERDTWNMDPVALEKAFKIYPDVRLVVLVHLYGTPAKVNEIREICARHNALLVEDAAESFGASYRGVQTGSFGDFNAISFNGNKIITGSSGGMYLTDSKEDADRVRKWSTQSREPAPWYQHEEIGYNYRMSNVIAGVVRGQLPHLDEHIAQKRAIYERYKAGLAGLPVQMNPYDAANSVPNFWLSCMIIDGCAVGEGSGKATPAKILQSLMDINAEGRPIWKPMHMQPLYRGHAFVTAAGAFAGKEGDRAFSGEEGADTSVGADIFARGLCLPSDNKMTPDQQDAIIAAIRECFE
ncbi:MAG: DegT/DnrJ/EryC1/StrS family aminotransferase [Fibrobacter sp.]|uniref:DegT/DnrJ/EryC1/StrS family aminotransferase n=1 Tax=Fibrobacter sp. TaxID=35828 RepID=UPI0025C5787A|nr:DegT/DnrJ/EryC1/StrS family aminotransferase [Fibrobacter sp.]MBQ3722038.1 DegT/DnrJ/EryC1/StrS family aminotransferase [Fibrobacter sp.]MBQ7079653.1 DegT/DnrJ/EryC1/StrS family aminotransferase [Fibrobacter sp.]